MIKFDKDKGGQDDMMAVIRCVPRPEAQLACALYDLLRKDYH